MSLKDEKVKEIIRHEAANFLSRESNRTSLITVTDIVLKDRGTRALVLFTVIPDHAEEAALDFLRRKRRDLRDHLKKHTKLRTIPFIDKMLDHGERNRQKIDELSSIDKQEEDDK